MADTILGNSTSTQALPIGESRTGAIDFAGDTDWRKVTLNAGFGFQAWLEGSTSGRGTLSDRYLVVYNSAGILQLSANDISLLNRDSYTYLLPSSAGNFFLSAEAYGNNTTETCRITIWQDRRERVCVIKRHHQ